MQTKVVELDLNDVLPNRFQPRIKFSEESIQALADSIKEHGVIQPIVVRNIGDKYEIIAGERRYKASVLAGKETIPAIITELNEKDSAEVAIIENVQRKDLTPIEEAISYKKILDMGYLTQDSLALKLGKTQSTIANKLRLLNLDDDVQEALLNEKISERHARSLLRLNSHEKQRKLLQKIINERLTVRKTDEEIDKMMDNQENTEVLNFGLSSVPTQELSKNDTEEIETLDFSNYNLESLNIPTEPIIEDSIPEILPIEPKPTTSFFNPMPEVINSTVPPVSLDMFKEVEETAQELNSVVEENNEIEEFTNFPNLDLTNHDFGSIDESTMNDIFTEKPLAPMDNLLQPSEQHTTNIALEETDNDTDESNEDILVPGKFFNLMPEEEHEESFKATNDTNFNFDVNNLNNLDFSDLNSNNSFENNNLENVNLTNELSTESLFGFNNLEDNTNVDLTQSVESSLNTNSEQNLEIPTFETFPNFEPVTLPELEPVNDENPLVVKNDNLEKKESNISDAINLVREFSENLNKLGFIVDLDEFDFENMYQVVFKINK